MKNKSNKISFDPKVKYIELKQTDAPPNWLREIKISLDSDKKLKLRLGYLSNNYGPLSILIYTRLNLNFHIKLGAS